MLARVCQFCNAAYGLNIAVNQLTTSLLLPTLLTFVLQELSTDVVARASEVFARKTAAVKSQACDRESVLAQIFRDSLAKRGQEELVGQLIAQFLGNVIAVHSSVDQDICYGKTVAR